MFFVGSPRAHLKVKEIVRMFSFRYFSSALDPPLAWVASSVENTILCRGKYQLSVENPIYPWKIPIAGTIPSGRFRGNKEGGFAFINDTTRNDEQKRERKRKQTDAQNLSHTPTWSADFTSMLKYIK